MIAFKLIAPVAVTLSLMASTAQAAEISIDNHSFEDSNLAPNSFDLGPVPGWSKHATGSESNAGVWRPTTGSTGAFDNIPDGTHIGYVFGNTTLFQELDAELAANTRYELSFNYGRRRDLGDGFAYIFSVVFAAGDLVLAQQQVSANNLSLGAWGDFTLDFTSQAVVPPGQRLAIYFTNNGHSGYIDNVRLNATALETPVETPEPAALGLLGLGLAALGFARRRIA